MHKQIHISITLHNCGNMSLWFIFHHRYTHSDLFNKYDPPSGGYYTWWLSPKPLRTDPFDIYGNDIIFPLDWVCF